MISVLQFYHEDFFLMKNLENIRFNHSEDA